MFNEYVVDPGAGDPNLGNVTVEDTITFPPDSAVIDPSSEGLLNQGLVLMNIRPAMTITVVGHTDSIGSEEYNLDLSQARADAVVQVVRRPRGRPESPHGHRAGGVRADRRQRDARTVAD